jgi:Flp pilus assembly protein TadG
MRTSLRQDGAVLIESALSMLVLLLVILGIMEASRLMQVQNTLTNAAREGARLAVTPLTGTSTLPPSAQISDTVARYLRSSAIDPSTATITPDPNVTFPPDPTQYTQVTVTLPYRVLTISFFGMLQVTLTGRSLMRNENSP